MTEGSITPILPKDEAVLEEEDEGNELFEESTEPAAVEETMDQEAVRDT